MGRRLAVMRQYAGIKYDTSSVVELLNANCWGWTRYPRNGRNGWQLHVTEKDTFRGRYLAANFIKGQGYYFCDVTKSGDVPISGPYKRLEDVKKAGMDYLASIYWLKLD